MSIILRDSFVKDDVQMEVRSEPVVSADHLMFNIEGLDLNGEPIGAGVYLNRLQIQSLVDNLNGWLVFSE